MITKQGNCTNCKSNDNDFIFSWHIFSVRSMIVDPMGVILTSGGEAETLILSDIELNRVHRVREKLPSVVNRKPECYNLMFLEKFFTDILQLIFPT